MKHRAQSTEHRALITIVLLLFTVLINSCNIEQMPTNYERPQSINPPQLLTLMDTINYIGTSHNEVLDSLLIQMENLKSGNSVFILSTK